MPIQVICTGCQAKLKAPDTAAGKKTKCPKCQTVISVPAASEAPAASSSSVAAATPAAAAKTAATKSAAAVKTAPKGIVEKWFLQTPDGSQYGPVPRSEMDEWFSEGRVSAECQLLKQGSAQWQWAPEIYPSLKVAASTSAAASQPIASPLGPLSPAAASPLSPLGDLSVSPLTPAPSPLGSQGLAPLGSPGMSPLGSPTTSPFASSGMSPLGGPSPAATLPSYSSLPSSPALPSSPLNPYNAPAMGGSYGKYDYGERSGPHPMVIIAGIFHFLFAAWNAVICLLCLIGGVVLMAAGGAASALGANAQDAEAQSAAGIVAAFGAIGGVILILVGLFFLVYGILQVTTGIGLFRRRQWARVASFVFAGLGILLILFVGAGLLLNPSVINAIQLLAELAYVVILFVAMCMPDAVRGFR